MATKSGKSGSKRSGSQGCRQETRQVRSGNKPGPKPVKVAPHRRSKPQSC